MSAQSPHGHPRLRLRVTPRLRPTLPWGIITNVQPMHRARARRDAGQHHQSSAAGPHHWHTSSPITPHHGHGRPRTAAAAAAAREKGAGGGSAFSSSAASASSRGAARPLRPEGSAANRPWSSLTPQQDAGQAPQPEASGGACRQACPPALPVSPGMDACPALALAGTHTTARPPRPPSQQQQWRFHRLPDSTAGCQPPVPRRTSRLEDWQTI